jgi:hypothetical protein
MAHLKLFCQTTLLIIALAVLSQCAVNGSNGSNQEGTDNVACKPNVIDRGLQLLVVPLTADSNTFSFTLCSSGQPKDAVYSVYAGLTINDVTAGTMHLDAAERLTQVSSSTQAGTAFQVTFASSDSYFAIYQDKFDGFRYGLDDSRPMVLPHPIPGR